MVSRASRASRQSAESLDDVLDEGLGELPFLLHGAHVQDGFASDVSDASPVDLVDILLWEEGLDGLVFGDGLVF